MANNVILNFTADTGGLDEANQKLEALKDQEQELLDTIKQLKVEQQSAQFNAKNAKEQTKATKEYGDKINEVRKQVNQTNKSIDDLSKAQGNLKNSIPEKAVIQSLRSMRKELMDNIAHLRLTGQTGTEEYQKLINKLGEITDIQGDISREASGLASDTRNFDIMIEGAQGVAGAFSVAQGGMALFGAESEDMEKVMVKLQSAIAITTGLQQIQNITQKESNLMMALSTIQSTAAAKAEAYRRVIQIQGTSATIGATIAQKAFNIVANANPYVLLATALITVVGALYLFSKNTDDNIEKQKELNKQLDIQRGLLSTETDMMRRYAKSVEDGIQRQIDLAKAQQRPITEIQAMEDKLAATRKANLQEIINKNSQYITSLDTNKKKYDEAIKQMDQLNKYIDKDATIDFDIDGKKMTGKISEAIELTQKFIDDTGKSINIGLDLVDEVKEDNTRRAKLKADRTNEAKELAKQRADEAKKRAEEELKYQSELDESLKAEHLKAIKDDEAREALALKQQYEKKFEAIKGNSPTETTLRKQLEENMEADLQKIRNRYQSERERSVLDSAKKMSDLRLESLREGSEEYYREMEVNLIAGAEIEKDTVKNSVETQEEKGRQIEAIDKSLTARLTKLWDDYSEGYKAKSIDDIKSIAGQEALIATQQYEQGKLSKWEYENELDRITIDSLNKQIEVRRANGEDTVDLEQELSEKRIEIAEQEKEARKAIMEELANLMTSLGNAAFDSQKERLNQQLDDLNHYYTTDAEAAKKNKDLKLISEEEMAKRQLEIKRQMAKAEKDQALFNAFINMALGVTKALSSAPPPFNIALAAITAAASLVQISAIASRQLPKYWKGRKSGKGEFALAGEYGPEIMWIPQGASIMPAHDSLRAMNGDISMMKKWNMPAISPNMPVMPSVSAQMVNEARKTPEMKMDYDMLGRAVAKYQKPYPAPKVNVSFDRSGVSVTNGNRTTTYLNTRGHV